jgi:tetratricopeptide (TPR) repeat protein
VGARVRARRLALGLTQTALAGERFSKEYVSQIERGKTAPSSEALTWLAQRLGTDVAFLRSGVSAGDRERTETAIAQAERLTDEHEYTAAVAELDAVAGVVGAAVDPQLTENWVAARAWALVQLGELDAASALLERSGGHAAAPIVYLQGVVAYKRSDVEDATRLLSEALELATASGTASDQLRSDIVSWRSRCHRRARDWVAAREDVNLAIEFATSSRDARRTAYAYFQASLVHERMGEWLQARRDAERALDLFTEIGDRANVGNMLNNLGGLAHLLGNSGRAIDLLDESFRVAIETGSAGGAAHALGSLAEVRLARGDVEAAEGNARKALELFDGRLDYAYGIGMAQLTLSRSLLAQGRADEAEAEIHAAEGTFAQINSRGHEAAAALLHGDLATERGEAGEAAEHYREAAAALLPDLLASLAD